MPRVSVRVSPRREVVATLYVVGQHGETANGRRQREDVFYEKGFWTPPLPQPVPVKPVQPVKLVGGPPCEIKILNRPLSTPPPKMALAVTPEQRRRELETMTLNVPMPVFKQFISRLLGSRMTLEAFLEIRMLHRLKHADPTMQPMRRLSQQGMMDEERRRLKEEVNVLFRSGVWIHDEMLESQGLFARRVTRKGRRYYFSIDPRGTIETIYDARIYWNAKRDHQANRRRILRQYDA